MLVNYSFSDKIKTFWAIRTSLSSLRILCLHSCIETGTLEVYRLAGQSPGDFAGWGGTTTQPVAISSL